MLSPVRYTFHLKKAERCPVLIKPEIKIVLNEALVSGLYKKQYNHKPLRGTPVNKLPAMLRTLNDKYVIGGVFCELYKKYGHNLKWIKGYSGYVAKTETDVRQYHVPEDVLVWLAGKNLNELELDLFKDFIYRLDKHLAWRKKWPTINHFWWWFPVEKN